MSADPARYAVLSAMSLEELCEEREILSKKLCHGFGGTEVLTLGADEDAASNVDNRIALHWDLVLKEAVSFLS